KMFYRIGLFQRNDRENYLVAGVILFGILGVPERCSSSQVVFGRLYELCSAGASPDDY
ncbi:uncharacterized protein A4U43_C04F26040, partial [Asparagus officinalis]